MTRKCITKLWQEFARNSRGLLTVLAMPIVSVHAAPERPPVEFNIPSQPLATALNSLALQANCQMLFEDSIVSGLTAPIVVGLMSPEGALDILLANTALEYAEDENGTIVVRRKVSVPVVMLQPKKRPEPPATPMASLIPLPAEEEEGRWLVGLRASYFHPDNESAPFSSTGAPTVVVRADGISTTSRLLAELNLEYFFNRHWSGELSATLPRTFELALHNDAAPAGPGKIGTFRHMSDFLTLKYSFLADQDWRPYLGAGINMTTLYHVAADPYGLKKTAVGSAVQAGVDAKLAEGWFLNADVKWAEVKSGFRLRGSEVSTMHIDPVSFGVGIRHRFGATIPQSGASFALRSSPAQGR